jgi:hypothetical protein
VLARHTKKGKNQGILVDKRISELGLRGAIPGDASGNHLGFDVYYRNAVE